MFLKAASIVVVCIFAVFVSVEPLRCFTCSASSNTSDCFHGNPQSQAMNATNCTNGATQCFANFISTNVSTTVSRGCSVGGCFPQSTINTTINCCNTDLCNSNSTTPQPTPPPPTQPPTTNRQCYSCSTNGNTTADPCYAGATNNPVMLPVLCTTGVSYCYRETTTRNSISTTVRGCRSSSCSSKGCVTCATNLCNTMKGSANFNAGGFSFAGFMMLVIVGVYKSF